MLHYVRQTTTASGWIQLPVHRLHVKKDCRRIRHPLIRQTAKPRSRQSSFSSADREEQQRHLQQQAIDTNFYIRESTFGEMGNVVDIIMRSFYDGNKSPWNHLYGLAELNRLQQSYHSPDFHSEHRMLVAVIPAGGADDQAVIAPPRTRSIRTKHGEIIAGFVDIDGRIPNRPTIYRYNPRPYLSDLAVAPEYRRRGIARALVQACEEFCLHELRKDEIYIRVEDSNVAAVQMYSTAGYSRIECPDDRPGNNIVVLSKKLSFTQASKKTTDVAEAQHSHQVDVAIPTVPVPETI